MMTIQNDNAVNFTETDHPDMKENWGEEETLNLTKFCIFLVALMIINLAFMIWFSHVFQKPASLHNAKLKIISWWREVTLCGQTAVFRGFRDRIVITDRVITVGTERESIRQKSYYEMVKIAETQGTNDITSLSDGIPKQDGYEEIDYDNPNQEFQRNQSKKYNGIYFEEIDEGTNMIQTYPNGLNTSVEVFETFTGTSSKQNVEKGIIKSDHPIQSAKGNSQLPKSESENLEGSVDITNSGLKSDYKHDHFEVCSCGCGKVVYYWKL